MAMDFFAHQEHARKRTGLLLAYFTVAVGLIVTAVYAAFWLVLVWSRTRHQAEGPPLPSFFQPSLLLAVAAGTLALIVVGSVYKIFCLREGGEAVARMLGGRLLSPGSNDLAEQRLFNVVQEMAIASGVPMPPVFVLEEEDSINAFAAGYSPSNAVIAVTRGCLQLLNRDELQGVVAHEFSHILNGDMRLNIWLMGVLHGILLIALVGYGILRSVGHGRSSSKRGGGGIVAILVLGVLLLVIGGIGVFFAKLIKSAISRQREYLADAAAVQFTRNPIGLSGALKKIGGLFAGSQVQNAMAEEASHLFFGNALRPSFLSFMATHPPLEERIRRIDPAFNGDFPAVSLPVANGHRPLRDQYAGGLAGLSGAAPAAPRRVIHLPTAAERAKAGGLDPAAMVRRVGAPTAEHLEHAAQLVQAIPEALRYDLTHPLTSMDLVCALFLDTNPEVRQRQLAALAVRFPEDGASRIANYADAMAGLDRGAHLVMADLALPALQQISLRQFTEFKATIGELVAADARITLHEYALQRTLLSRLETRFGSRRTSAPEFFSLRAVKDDCEILLSALGYAGNAERAKAGHAFNSAVLRLGTTVGVNGIRPPAECGLAAVDAALTNLARLAPIQKRQLLEGCVTCVATDRYVTIEEAELICAVSAALDCPMPPFLPGELQSVPPLPS